MKIYDISQILNEHSFVYIGDPEFNMRQLASLADGDDYNFHSISLSLHTGTHIDAPLHFIADGMSIDKISIERFVVPVLVVNYAQKSPIDKDFIASINIKEGYGLLIRTVDANKDICLTTDAANEIVAKKITLLGLDQLSSDALDSEDYPVHKILLPNNILLLENIVLTGVPDGEYCLVCAPLKIENAEASPVRALLIEN
jgi:arylformamidase